MKYFPLLLISILCLPGCGEKAPDKEEQALTASIAAGETVFEQNCAQCHPRSGRGNYLSKIPADMLTRRSAFELMEWIRGRDQHREMPSFADLSDDELDALVAYLKTEVNR